MAKTTSKVLLKMITNQPFYSKNLHFIVIFHIFAHIG